MTKNDVILGKGEAHDRGPVKHIEDEKLEISHKNSNNLSVNGSPVARFARPEDDRKAQALKANLAKRKQQQRSRSLL